MQRLRKNRGFVSMRVKFMAVLSISAVSVILFAYTVIPFVVNTFTNSYMQEEKVESRQQSYYNDFSKYVKENQIESDDEEALEKWFRNHRSVTLIVFNGQDYTIIGPEDEDDTTTLEDTTTNDVAEGDTTEADGEQTLPEEDSTQADEEPTTAEGNNGIDDVIDENSKKYDVQFADGQHQVYFVDNSLSAATSAIVTLGVILSITLFLFVMLIYYHNQTNAIVRLSHQVEAVSSGALDAPLVSKRNDEIGRLARDVDNMRSTILEKMEEKEEAWQANSDLLTSMTHDIRTPLTTLLGYMELLGGDNPNMTDEQRAYIRVSTQKAEQIKGLSDQLFLYFWALNRAETQTATETETCEASLLFQQLIGDYIPAMAVAGLTVETDLSAIASTDTVRVHIDCLRRVTDNVFDNMRKYADRAHPVEVTGECRDGMLTIRFKNAIGQPEDRPSGTRIGVKTCKSMMELMGGSFDTYTEENFYTAALSVPIERNLN